MQSFAKTTAMHQHLPLLPLNAPAIPFQTRRTTAPGRLYVISEGRAREILNNITQLTQRNI